MKRFAVLTSSGDAAGMNAAIRTVVRTGLDNGWQPTASAAGASDSSPVIFSLSAQENRRNHSTWRHDVAQRTLSGVQNRSGSLSGFRAVHGRPG